MVKIIDTHTHLFDESFDADRADVMARAEDAGVCRMMCPAIDSASHQRLFDLCDSYPSLCLPMMGLHPTSVNDNLHWRAELELAAEYLAAGQRRFYAVGEVGLDLYWSRDWLKEQEEAFEYQIELALRYQLPLVVHTRDAWAEVLAILAGYKGRGLKGIMHAFSGSIDDYRAVKECGDFLFGFGGTVTYKKSTLPELLSVMPLEDIVLETDSPYLPPVPFRGKRNESSYIRYVAARIAEIKDITELAVAETTTANAVRIFGLTDL